MNDRESSGVDRRQYLSTIAVVAGLTTLSGCSSIRDSPANQHGATDVIAYNAGADRKSVNVTITADDSEEPHTERTLELAPGEEFNPVNRSKLPTNASYTVDVAVESGPNEPFEWDDPVVGQAPLWIFIDDSQNIKFLLQAG